jgi:superfamily II DNA/RNA helicase
MFAVAPTNPIILIATPTHPPPLPLSNSLSPQNEGDGPYALVLAPSRELVLQIEQETNKLAQFMNIRTVSIVGGVSIEEQVHVWVMLQ